MEGIAIYFYQPSTTEGQKNKLTEKISSFRQKVIEELRENKTLMQVGDNDDSGS